MPPPPAPAARRPPPAPVPRAPPPKASSAEGSPASAEPAPAHPLTGRTVVFRRPDDRSRRWFEGTIAAVEGNDVTVHDAGIGRDVRGIKPGDIAIWNGDENVAAIHDMSHLSYIAPPCATYALQQRYYAGLPYTMVGDKMLVSINPYKFTPVPHGAPSARGTAKKVMEQLQKPTAESGVSSAAVVVTGTSGAGKTEAIKMVLGEVVKLSGAATASRHGGDGTAVASDPGDTGVGVMARLQAAHAVLESFGNAVTPHNTNSSRFSKLVDLTLVPGPGGALQVDAAAVSCYLLESTRLIARGPGESNFHVLYALFDGLDSERQAELDLWDPGLFACLTAGDDAPQAQQDFIVCAPPFKLKEIAESLVAIGFDDAKVALIWRLLAAVLHLLNVQFVSSSDFAPARVNKEGKSGKAIARAAHLMYLPQAELEIALTSISLNPATTRNFDRATAYVCRDALAKSLYASLFSMVLSQLNSGMAGSGPAASKAAKPPPDARHLLMLDMFGFEAAGSADGANGLEQLLINSTNEAVQHLFDTAVISHFEAELDREGVATKAGDAATEDNGSAESGDRDGGAASPGSPQKVMTRNAKVLSKSDERRASSAATDALLGKKGSILATVSDESLMARQGATPQQQAQELCDKVLELCGTHRGVLSRPKLQKDAAKPTFIVTHYAGAVEYTTADMASRNRLMPSPGVRVAKDCAFAPVAELLKNPASPVGFAADGSTSRSGLVTGPQSLAASFRDQLEGLLARLRGTDLHWIRCIKPNSSKAPDSFATAAVEGQMRDGGVFHGLAQLGSGLAIRLPHREFVGMGLCLLPSTPCAELEACKFRHVAATLRKHLQAVGDWMREPSGGTDDATIAEMETALAGIRVGTSKVFMTRPASSCFRELVQSQHSVIAAVIARVATSFATRRELGALRQERVKRDAEEAHASRLRAERPIRLELERRRLQHEADHGGAVMARLKRNAKRVSRGARVLAEVPPVLQRLEKELRRASAEIALNDEVCQKHEAAYEEKAKYLHELQLAAAERETRERERKAKEEWAQQLKAEEARKNANRLAHEERAKKSHEQHVKRLFAAARQQQARDEVMLEVQEIEERKRRHVSSQRRWVASHLNRANSRLANEVEMRRAAAARSNVADAMLARSMERSRTRAQPDESRAKLTEVLGPDASMILGDRHDVSRSTSVQAVPLLEGRRGRSVVSHRGGHDDPNEPGLLVSQPRAASSRAAFRSATAADDGGGMWGRGHSMGAPSVDGAPSSRGSHRAIDDPYGCPPASQPPTRDPSIAMTEESEAFWKKRRDEWQAQVAAV